jgi:hypothetical protein
MDAEEQQSTSTEEETEDMLSVFHKSDVGERLSTTMSSSMKDIGPFKQSTFVQMPKSMTDFTSDLSDNEHNERGIPVRYNFVTELPQYKDIIQKNVLSNSLRRSDKNFMFYQESVLFFKDLNQKLVNSKNVKHIRQVKVLETEEYKELLGSQGLSTDIKSILYKLVPSAISKKKKH